MQCFLKCAKLSVVFALVAFAAPNLTQAQHYTQTNLVSNISGKAATTDPNLKNPWGLTRSPGGSPWWVGNNNSGTSTLYDGAGTPQNFFPDPHPDSNGNGINSPFNNFVMVPPPGFAPGIQSAQTGVFHLCDRRWHHLRLEPRCECDERGPGSGQLRQGLVEQCGVQRHDLR